MKLHLIAAACLMPLAASPAFAGPDCEGKAMTTPMWQVAKTFEEQGGQIRDMKVEDGCYEIKGEVGGKKFEVHYDPTSGAELERIAD